MQNDYESFLEFRAARRQLAATFASPHLLLFHVIAFVVVMTGIWAYGNGWNLWIYRDNFIFPVLIGLAWSLVLAGHALLHYRRSAAITIQREQAVEDAMRQLIVTSPEAPDDATLFEMHRLLETPLQAQSRWSISLGAFALVNLLSWVAGTVNMGSSWPFQMTIFFAVLIVGGGQAYQHWQSQRSEGRNNWFTRVPLLHFFIYMAGVIVLMLLQSLRAINYWDADNLFRLWSLILLAHTAFNILVKPALEPWLAKPTNVQPRKQKHAYAVALGDDGELVTADEDDVDFYEGETDQRARRR